MEPDWTGGTAIKNGEISRKHGIILVRTLRKILRLNLRFALR
jgi:hypothetical protein